MRSSRTQKPQNHKTQNHKTQTSPSTTTHDARTHDRRRDRALETIARARIATCGPRRNIVTFSGGCSWGQPGAHQSPSRLMQPVAALRTKLPLAARMTSAGHASDWMCGLLGPIWHRHATFAKIDLLQDEGAQNYAVHARAVAAGGTSEAAPSRMFCHQNLLAQGSC
ncbi:unnamed protein product [Durusdinium trenchii]|uniref:Uncharacterized protein n=1 Tax=Durusdinium trenchii TaxID=1381693 RepID=A0ABP0QF94_9DINO